MAINVFNGVIDNGVLVVVLQSFIRFQFIAEDDRTGFDMLRHLLLKFMLASVVYDHRSDVAAAFQHSHHYGLILPARSGDDTLALPCACSALFPR
jgi:hypothetical protein